MRKQNESSTILSLHQEIEREVREIEEEMARHPELDGLQVTEEMDRALLEEIEAYEKELEERRMSVENTGDDFLRLRENSAVRGDTDCSVGADGAHGADRSEKFRASESSAEFSEELVPDLTRMSLARRAAGDVGKAGGTAGGDGERKEKVCYRRKKAKYWVVSLVAVLLIVLGVGVNSVGSKSYLKTLWDTLLGDEPIKYVDVEDMEIQETEDGDELAAYKEIKEKLNIKPVRIIYKPDDMKLVEFEISEEILTAQLLYKYQDETIRYIIYINDVDSSWGQKEEDNKVNEYSVLVNEIEIEVEEYQVHNVSNNRQTANFEYQGVHYQLIGVMEKLEFEKILKSLYFF
jgi:hypothetical protein